eukprot:g8442.t1
MPRGERPSVIRRPKWSPEEDAQLVRLVEQHGVGNWAAIARDLKSTNNRDKKAVRSRWVYQLDPNVNKGPFTADEENVIFEQYEKVGAHWAEIAKALPGRTDGAIKNYWNGHLVKKLPYRKPAIKTKRKQRKSGKKASESSSMKAARPIHDVMDKLDGRPSHTGYPSCPADWGLKYEGTVYPDFDFSLTSEASSKRPKAENEAQSVQESFLKTETEWNPLWYPPGALQSTGGGGGGVTTATPTVSQQHWAYPWANEYPPTNNPLSPWGGVQNWMKDYANICNNARRNEQRNSCQTAESLLERGPSTEMD